MNTKHKRVAAKRPNVPLASGGARHLGPLFCHGPDIGNRPRGYESRVYVMDRETGPAATRAAPTLMDRETKTGLTWPVSLFDSPRAAPERSPGKRPDHCPRIIVSTVLS